jgi:hypothetical protein
METAGAMEAIDLRRQPGKIPYFLKPLDRLSGYPKELSLVP